MKWTEKKTEKIRFLPTSKLSLGSTVRERGDADSLVHLTRSIARYGILHPLAVKRTLSGYELICGSRRLRAARLLGMERVPCRILQLSPREEGEISLAENLQRQPLSPFEEGAAADRLLRAFPYRRGELADRLGESPSELASKLRLLRFSAEERQLLAKFDIPPEYSEVLLRVRDPALRILAIRHVGSTHLSVEETEELCLSLSLHPEEFIPPLRPKREREEENIRRFVIKDVGFFINSVDRAIGSIRQAGFDVEAEKIEVDGFISYSIRIPKGRE